MVLHKVYEKIVIRRKWDRFLSCKVANDCFSVHTSIAGNIYYVRDEKKALHADSSNWLLAY